MTFSDVWLVAAAAVAALALTTLATMVLRAVSAIGQVPDERLAVPRGDGTWIPLGAPGAPPSSWYAHVPRPSGAPRLGETGMLELTDGELVYTPAGATAAAWRCPTYAIRAQHHTRPFIAATLDLWLPTGQLLHLEVSRKPIEQWWRGPNTNLTRPKEAHVFLQQLGANGALVSATPRWRVPPGGRMVG